MIGIRPERNGEETAIRLLTARAFAGQVHSNGSEPQIVDNLRKSGDLTLSFVAEEDSAILGHIAYSPVTISDGTSDWYGLGPVSVEPARQGEGIGSMLVNAGLECLREIDANGCVLLGDPAYYIRFGFRHDPRLIYPGPPPEYFQFLRLKGNMPTGEVRYAPGFG